MGGIAVALTFLLKQQTDLSIKSNQDSALSIAKSEITAILTNPLHCNANVATLPISSARTAVANFRKCKAHASNPKCLAAISNPSVMVEDKFPSTPTTGSWKNTNILDDRLKITKIERSIAPVSVGTCPAAYAPCKALTTATFYVTFTRRKVVQTSPGSPPVEEYQNLPEIAIPTVVVVTGPTSVLGCPKSWNSTELY